MKEELIDKLFEELIKDKRLIKLNLLQALDYIILETHNKSGRLILTLEYKKNEKEVE